MKYLLYGIVRHDSAAGRPEAGVSLLPTHGLAAAVSAVEEIPSPPRVSDLLAFERVVEAIHERQAIIPLRYGCVMDSESAVIRLLEERRPDYERLLIRLLGMTEMAVRVLWPARPEALPGLPRLPGAAYLASLRTRYNLPGGLTREEDAFAGQVLEVLSGCFAEQRSEASASNQGRLVSLYLLTPRLCAEQLRSALRRICPPRGAKLLSSGPWPPYNFVNCTG